MKFFGGNDAVAGALSRRSRVMSTDRQECKTERRCGKRKEIRLLSQGGGDVEGDRNGIMYGVMFGEQKEQ